MRNAFSEELIELTKKDDDIILLAGDIGFRIFDKFINLFPNKFINCGIAEQNMISVAAGLASEGKLPVVYTIVPFLIMRGVFEPFRPFLRRFFCDSWPIFWANLKSFNFYCG